MEKEVEDGDIVLVLVRIQGHGRLCDKEKKVTQEVSEIGQRPSQWSVGTVGPTDLFFLPVARSSIQRSIDVPQVE